MSRIKVGDLVRPARTPFFRGTEKDLAEVMAVHGNVATLKGIGFNYYLDALVVVVSHVPTEPEPAEEGVYIAVRLDAEGKPIFPPSTTPTQFKYWVDAERNLEECLKTLPRERFGVLKLVATVSNQPAWS